MVLATSLGSALFYALASVLQHRGAAAAPAHEAMRPGLLVGLVKNPLWVAGIGADILAFLLQFWALGHGPLVLVQPLLVSGLLFALPLGALMSRQRIPVGEILGACSIVAGLSIFLGVAHPTSGRPASGTAWLVTAGVTLGPCLAVAIATTRQRALARRKAELLAAAGGVLFGLAASLIKVTATKLLHHGLVHTLVSWQPYVLVAVGAASLLMVQSAFQAGPLSSSLPVMTVVDPLASILIGAITLREGIAHSPGAIFLEGVGLVLMATGILYDGRSLLVTGGGVGLDGGEHESTVVRET